ncbi:hypothetical protein HGM15179_014031 [Zosterops borbonicus]|uniref:Uncharacterized protein n=1 Tax=Zosterops borbonicus TaxID=364589 RepID=A0A8K1G710_9PASS|nr:hypothetical protein HGM15179_014031 [Zosterops borbonicus]
MQGQILKQTEKLTEAEQIAKGQTLSRDKEKAPLWLQRPEKLPSLGVETARVVLVLLCEGPDHIHASVGELASVTMRLLSMVFEKLWRLEDVYKTGRKPLATETDPLWSGQEVHEVRNWLKGGTQSRIWLVFQPATWKSWSSPGMDLGPTLFHIFINYVKDVIKFTLVKFVEDIKPSRRVDAVKGTATLQEDLDRLED